MGAGCDDQMQLGNPVTFDKFIAVKYNRDWRRAPHPFNELQASAKPLEIDSDLLMMATGRHHSACLRTDGSLFTWGVGLCGQLGLSRAQILDYD